MAYFPFLFTSVVPANEINYQNIAPGPSFVTLKQVLTWQAENLYGDTPRKDQIVNDIQKMQPLPPDHVNTPEEAKAVLTLNQNLTATLPLLGEIESIILAKNSVLPASGAMAGIYTRTDSTRGVWNAPANVTVNSVIAPTYKLTGLQQGDLNLPVVGKAVDALREFTGRGTVVWGARTLDGNSNDYRYIQVRRTLIYVEQSIKAALNQFVFAANDGNTWTTVTAMVSSFLQGVWSQGGLMGATASEAFTVQCGLGSTMTAQDILDGYMRVQVVLQMLRPAEFIELTFTQKMEGAA
jgi:phage tail sheath protein FI